MAMTKNNKNELERTIRNALNSTKFAQELAKDGVLRVTIQEARQKLYLALGMIEDGKD